MEKRYLNKKSLEELSSLVKAKEYYQGRLDKLGRLKEKIRGSKKLCINFIISDDAGPEFDGRKMKEFALVKASDSPVDCFEMIPNRVIEELQTELMYTISVIESYLWDRFGYTDDEAAMKEAELQDGIDRFMLETDLQIEISPNVRKSLFVAATPIWKIIEAMQNKRTDRNDNGGGKQDEQV
ncbi:hypothetical protein [Phascolarctobacterium sp.]